MNVPATMKRSERLRATVLEASVALLGERGLSGFTVDAVSDRTGIAKTTIYRHWSSRSDLIVSTIDTLAGERHAPDTGDLREDLLEYFTSGVRVLEDGSYPRQLQTIPGLIEAGQGDPELAAAVGRATTRILADLKGILERARARGEVRDDRDLETASNIFAGAIFVRRAFLDQSPTDTYIAAFVDTILDGLTPRPESLVQRIDES